MHKVIRIIIYESSGEEARNKAEQILNENLIQEGYGVFDYGTFFDDDDSTTSGKARWGNLSSVALADSDEGRKLIDDGMKFTREVFLENMAHIRKAIEEYSDEELFEGKLLDVKKKILNELNDEKEEERGLEYFRHDCGSVKPYNNPNFYLYGDEGEAIDKPSHLKDVLNKWDKKNDLKVYVVPVDVHY